VAAGGGERLLDRRRRVAVKAEALDQVLGRRRLARLRALEHDDQRDQRAERLGAERQRAVEQVEAQQRLDEPLREAQRPR
jgi:hypothetical protein